MAVTAVLLGLGLTALAILVYAWRKVGQLSVQKQQATSDAATKDEQLKIAANQPRDKQSLIDRLREHGF